VFGDTAYQHRVRHGLQNSQAASARQDNNGGRKSISAVIESLVRQHWNELEAEVGVFATGLGD
jgi:hypothetical protein